jgi:hypothetical protein
MMFENLAVFGGKEFFLIKEKRDVDQRNRTTPQT